MCTVQIFARCQWDCAIFGVNGYCNQKTAIIVTDIIYYYYLLFLFFDCSFLFFCIDGFIHNSIRVSLVVMNKSMIQEKFSADFDETDCLQMFKDLTHHCFLNSDSLFCSQLGSGHLTKVCRCGNKKFKLKESCIRSLPVYKQ